MIKYGTPFYNVLHLCKLHDMEFKLKNNLFILFGSVPDFQIQPCIDTFEKFHWVTED